MKERNCASNSPIPIALDEELIGVTHVRRKEEKLLHHKPGHIIILKT